MIRNFLIIYKSWIGWVGFLLGILIIAFPAYFFIQKDLIIGNLGHSFYITEVLTTILIAILFGLFLGGSLYKMYFFRTVSNAKGFLGGFLGILVSGCPACSITLASYIGIAGFISQLPGHGLELKFLSIILLFFADFVLIRNLQVCKIKN